MRLLQLELMLNDSYFILLTTEVSYMKVKSSREQTTIFYYLA